MKKLFTAENGITLVIALVMLNNIEHLAWVHYDIARRVFAADWMNWLHSVLVVVIIEIAIIVLVRKGMDVFAGVYTFMLLILTLLYYPLGEYWNNGELARLLAAIIYSLMFTLSIWYFARMAAMKKRTAEKEGEFQLKYYELAKEREQYARKIQQLTAEMEQHKKERLHVEAKLQQFTANPHVPAVKLQEVERELVQLRAEKKMAAAARTCEKCGTEFPSEASKRSHIGRCTGNINQTKQAS